MHLILLALSLHDHRFYFTTENALMASGRDHTTLTSTIICRSVLLEHTRIIFNSHACKLLPVSALESLSPESSSSASVTEFADESLAMGLN